MSTPPSWPLDSPEHLADALREQDATREEVDALLPALLRLSEWQAPESTPADTARLLARLKPLLPTVSPVRQAIHTRQARRRGRLSVLLETACIQVSILHLTFWLLSLVVIVAGAAAILSAPLDQSLLLRAIGPFLAYLSTTTAFRGASLRVTEFELTCPPSPVQLAIARLVIVLSYDLGLGLLLSLVLWAAGSGSFLILTLHWLMPLLLVAGLALLLSLRLGVYTAAALAYGGWLAFLVLDSGFIQSDFSPLIPLTIGAEVVIGLVGLASLAIALLRIQSALPRILPRS